MSVYHYTDLNGFQGIVERNTLWATNIYHLNDSKEYHHGVKCFLDALDYLDYDFVDPGMRTAIEEMMGHYRRNQGAHIFSTSFCLIPDQLSQWRGYGNKQGVCIELDENKLHDTFKHLNLKIQRGNVFYTKEDSTIEARNEIDAFISMSELAKAFNEDKFRRNIYLYNVMIGLIPFFKHEGFKEEKEYRFVYLPVNEMPSIDFRVSGDRIIPFIQPSPLKGVKLPIKKIIIGPAKVPEDVVASVKYFLKYHNYGGVDVVSSQIPYRT